MVSSKSLELWTLSHFFVVGHQNQILRPESWRFLLLMKPLKLQLSCESEAELATFPLTLSAGAQVTWWQLKKPLFLLYMVCYFMRGGILEIGDDKPATPLYYIIMDCETTYTKDPLLKQCTVHLYQLVAYGWYQFRNSPFSSTSTKPCWPSFFPSNLREIRSPGRPKLDPREFRNEIFPGHSSWDGHFYHWKPRSPEWASVGQRGRDRAGIGDQTQCPG